MKRVIALLLTLVMLLGLAPTALAAEAAAPDGTVVKAEEVSGTPRLDAMAENDSAAETTQPTGHQPDDMVTILVELERAPVLEALPRRKRLPPALPVRRSPPILPGGRAEKQDAAIRRDQKKVFAEIQAAQPAALQAEGTSTAGAPELMEQWTVLFNGMAVRAPYGMLDTIRGLKGVKSAHVQHVYSEPASPATNAGVAGYSYDMVHLQEVWNKGYTGKGMLVAVVDSGLDMEYSSWWSDEEGANVTGLRRVHEAFRDDSFYSQLSNSDLRYTKESLLAFLNGRQLNANRLSPASNEAMYKTRKVPFAFGLRRRRRPLYRRDHQRRRQRPQQRQQPRHPRLRHRGGLCPEPGGRGPLFRRSPRCPADDDEGLCRRRQLRRHGKRHSQRPGGRHDPGRRRREPVSGLRQRLCL